MVINKQCKLYLILFVSALLLTSGIKFYSHFYKHDFVSFDVAYSLADTPIISAKIDEKEILLKLDLGSKYQLFLEEKFLEVVKKTELGTQITRDTAGNKYQNPYYRLSSLELGPLCFHNVIAHSMSQEEINNSIYWKKENVSQEETSVGLLGRPVLESWNYLLDFPHQKFILCNSLDKLKENGYSFEDFIKVPVNCTPFGVILTFSTDLGQVRLLLDTGCTLTMVRSKLVQNRLLKADWRNMSYVTVEKFEIGRRDFKNQNIYAFNLSDELTLFDGVLGMDFLKQHILYLDRENSLIYIK